MKDYVIWGATGHCKVVREAIKSQFNYDLVALFDNNPDLKSPYENIPLYHGDDFNNWLANNNSKKLGFVVAIGGANGRSRYQISNDLWAKGLEPISFTHPRSIVSSDCLISSGVQIMAGANISVNVRIGKWSIINHSTNIDHDCTIGSGVHIAPGAILTGEVSVGDYSFIGAGATVLPRVKIGENSIVGAGAVVTKDVPSNTIVVGVPAHYYKDNDISHRLVWL